MWGRKIWHFSTILATFSETVQDKPSMWMTNRWTRSNDVTVDDLDRQDRKVTVFVCARTFFDQQRPNLACIVTYVWEGRVFVSHAPHLCRNPQVANIWDLLPYVYDVHSVWPRVTIFGTLWEMACLDGSATSLRPPTQGSGAPSVLNFWNPT